MRLPPLPPPLPPPLLLLLLLPFIITGVDGDVSAAPATGGLELAFPCRDLVCFHLWRLSAGLLTGDHVAVVGNGGVEAAKSAAEGPQCTLDVRDLTAGYVGHDRRCEERPDVFMPDKSALRFKLRPGDALSLRCVLLAYAERGRCGTPPLRRVTLAWVDQTGGEVRRDPRHRVRRVSDCDVTLTVAVRRLNNERFRCRATVGDEAVETSVEVGIRVPARKGRGRGIVPDSDPQPQGRKQHAVGAAVGVLGCAALAAGVALFVARRRRANRQSPDESSLTPGADNIKSEDGVIYAQVVHPAGPDTSRIHEHESTDYACVRLR